MKKFVFGSWSISGDYGYKNEKETKKTLLEAYNKGIRQYDTAPNYGHGYAEFVLGDTLSKKKNIIFNTKIGNNHSKKKSFSLKDIEKSFFKSLRNLKKINTLFLHNPRYEEDMDKLYLFLEDLKKNKLINNFGISLAKNFKYKKKDLEKYKIFQLDYNLLNFSIIKSIKNKIIYARSPLASGLLARDFDLKKIKINDHRKTWLDNSRLSNINLQKKFIKQNTADDLIFNSIHFVKKTNFVNYIIFGTKNSTQLEQMVSLYKKKNNTNFKELIKKIKNNPRLFLKKAY